MTRRARSWRLPLAATGASWPPSPTSSSRIAAPPRRLRRPGWPTSCAPTRTSRDWAPLVGAVLRRALEAHGRIREIDAPGEATPPALTLLFPVQRAIAGGHLLAGVPLDDLAAALGMPVGRARRELVAAEGIGVNRERLRAALETASAGRAFVVTADQVEAAFALPPPGAVHASRAIRLARRRRPRDVRWWARRSSPRGSRQRQRRRARAAHRRPPPSPWASRRADRRAPARGRATRHCPSTIG